MSPATTRRLVAAVGGATLADAMFRQAVLSPSSTHRTGLPLLLSEVVATAGLLLVIVKLARTGRSQAQLTG